MATSYNTSDDVEEQQTTLARPSQSFLNRVYTHPWFQIILIGVICFCCQGVRPSKQSLTTELPYFRCIMLWAVSEAVAKWTRRLLRMQQSHSLLQQQLLHCFLSARSSILLVPDGVGFVGGWTYALYSGALLCYNRLLSPIWKGFQFCEKC
jgi:hypothetical protein